MLAWQANEVLDRACLICGRKNRHHKVFFSPYTQVYQKQWVNDDMVDEMLVPSHDHYACINNLEFLEWKAKQRG